MYVLQRENDNRTSVVLDLVGIPSETKGVPQLKQPDIDANGIVHVRKRFRNPGKEQKIRIESSSGSEDEIKRMIKEAETNAADKKQ